MALFKTLRGAVKAPAEKTTRAGKTTEPESTGARERPRMAPGTTWRDYGFRRITLEEAEADRDPLFPPDEG